MEEIRAANGQMVTEAMLSRWTEALDKDKWPGGEHNIGATFSGRPPLSAEGSSVLSIKIPPAMKKAIEGKAKSEGTTTSDFVRAILAEGLANLSR